MRSLSDVLVAMHKIIIPGDYGLGTEPESIPHDDKKAWQKLGELIDEAMKIQREEGVGVEDKVAAPLKYVDGRYVRGALVELVNEYVDEMLDHDSNDQILNTTILDRQRDFVRYLATMLDMEVK
jgi:hypothetical protein